MSAFELLRAARRESGLTQAQLAWRAGTTQPVVARIERAGADPRTSTLERLLRAAGRELATRPLPPASSSGLDEAQIRERLRLAPAERLATFQASQRNLERLRAGARRVSREDA